ncbi:MAG: HAD family hydrolase, partial [Oscillospiraceae bacterium]|nr:HAD family hydrolase [Oscillospiraceae bacterium]
MSILDHPFDPSYILQKKRSLKRQLLAKEGLVPKKVALLSGSTIGEIKNILEVFLLANGIKPEFHEGEYARFYEDLVFDNGALKDFAPDFVYIHTSQRNIRNWPQPADSAQDVTDKLNAEFNYFTQAAKAALSLGCPVIINNFDLPVYRVMGSKEGSDPCGRVNFVQRLNLMLADFIHNTPNLYLNDLCYLQARHGMDVFSDQTAWYAYKYCCAIDCIPYLAQSVANIVKSLLGKNKKAL